MLLTCVLGVVPPGGDEPAPPPGLRADVPFRTPRVVQLDPGPAPVPMPLASPGSRPVPMPEADPRGQTLLREVPGLERGPGPRVVPDPTPLDPREAGPPPLDDPRLP